MILNTPDNNKTSFDNKEAREVLKNIFDIINASTDTI